MLDHEVPDWCAFFSAEEFDTFCEAVDDALSAFGAEGQDVDGGWVSLAAGAPTVEVYEFPLEPVAARCRDVPCANWESVCFGVIHGWIDGAAQREWLRASKFIAVASQLRVWVSNQPPTTFESELADPAQPFSQALHDAYHVSFWIQVPELGDIPSIPAFVPNEAVAAWGASADELIAAAQDRLRRLPGLAWETITVELLDQHDKIEATVALQYLLGEPDSDPLPAAWALILNEIAPRPIEPGTLLAMPARQLLLLSYPEPDLDEVQRLRAVAHHADHAWNTAAEDQLSPCDYRWDADNTWRIADRENVGT
jgi:hypothetical protein